MHIESAADIRRYVRESYPDATVEQQYQIYQAIRTHPDRPAYSPTMTEDFFGKTEGKGSERQWRKFFKRFDASQVIG